MKLALLLVLSLQAACAGPKPKPPSPIVEGVDVPESCCCKSNPLSSEDGKPVYTTDNRMECSAKQGECVAEVLCQKTSPE